MPDFVAIVRQYNMSDEPFRIEGMCKSACTLFLGVRNVCVERSATLMMARVPAYSRKSWNAAASYGQAQPTAP